jgi:hypothetical protein
MGFGCAGVCERHVHSIPAKVLAGIEMGANRMGGLPTLPNVSPE